MAVIRNRVFTNSFGNKGAEYKVYIYIIGMGGAFALPFFFVIPVLLSVRAFEHYFVRLCAFAMCK